MVPAKYKPLVDSCRRLNPDYEHRLWSDKDIRSLINASYPWFLQTFDSYKYPIQRVDVGRLFMVYYHGGIYLDMDIKCKVPFTEIQRNHNFQQGNISVLLSNTDPIGITNNMFMSQARDPFFHYLIRRLLLTKGEYLSPHWTVMLASGSVFLYRTYLKYPCKEHIGLIPTYEHSAVYFEHQQAGTWHHWDGPIITFLDWHGRELVKILGVVYVIVLIRLFWMSRAAKKRSTLKGSLQ